MKNKADAEQETKVDLSKSFVIFSLTLKQRIKDLFAIYTQLSYGDIMYHISTASLTEVVSICKQLAKEEFIEEIKK